MTTHLNLFKVLFFTVSHPPKKLKKIVDICHEYFNNKKKLLLLAPHQEAALYIDKLLWSNPPSSFLPHDLVDDPLKTHYLGPLYIVQTLDQTFEASSIFNLCDNPVKDDKNNFKMIYEFEDVTSQEKIASFQNRLKYYQSNQKRIISYPL